MNVEQARLNFSALRAPRALLLDFDGVVVETQQNLNWEKTLAEHLVQELAAARADTGTLTARTIEADLSAAALALSQWSDAMSRPFAPRELEYTEFWNDFVAADWSDETRAFVNDNAFDLSFTMNELRQVRVTRPGMIDVLDTAAAAGMPVAIVSNTMMGAVNRQYLQTHGLTDKFSAQIYSSEARVRKPNPKMIELGAQSLGVSVADCWFVGDNLDRDVLCGFRAGVGGNILMESRDTYAKPYDLAIEPQAIVADPYGLLEHLKRAIGRPAA